MAIHRFPAKKKKVLAGYGQNMFPFLEQSSSYSPSHVELLFFPHEKLVVS